MKKTELSALIQGLDGMPDGICFCESDGTPVFMNEKMKELMTAAFTAGTDDTSVFEKTDAAGLKDGCRTVKSRDSVYLVLQNGSAWSIKTGKIRVKEKEYNEYIAYDVTELYGKSLELKRRNRHIAATNEKIRKYSKSMDAMIRERELLDAKIRIHDDVGRALLSLRSYLYREDKDRDSLVKLWQITVSVLRREKSSDQSDDRMEALTEAAAAVDVKLTLDGAVPDGAVIREISAAAIRECLTNTVKHAQGHNLYVKTSQSGGTYTIRIKNDGIPPKAPIEETGGLHTLRSSVERYGGKMRIKWKNGFELTVTLDYFGKEDQNEQNKGNDS